MEFERYYKNGRKNGIWKEWEFDEKKLIKMESYKNGMRDGVWREWSGWGWLIRDEKYKAGILMIQNQLLEIFKALEVSVIDRVGEEFDPNLENAVMQVSDESLGENVVAAVLQKGYKLGDKVIRPAMVSVANC